MSKSRYQIVNTNSLDAVPCPCGFARRAFVDDPDQVASLHVVDITDEGSQAAKTHYHKKMTEIYYVLQGQGQIELDGIRVDVEPGTSVMIKPGCRHRLIGKFKIINVPIPAFDPDDEWFD